MRRTGHARACGLAVLVLLPWCAGCGGSSDPPPQGQTPATKTTGTQTAGTESPGGSEGSGGTQTPSAQGTTGTEPEVDERMTIETQEFGTSPEGQPVVRYVLSNGRNLKVSVLDFGALVTAVETPDRDGKWANLTLGFDSPAGWFANAPYLGAICGRYANRIANGTFTLDGKQYQVTPNEQAATQKNCLHGGVRGFHKVTWKAEPVKGKDFVGVKLTYVSPAGEEGFPGTLTTVLTYSVTAADELKMEYSATTDAPTVLNLTNHCYWNLGGAGSGDVLGHELSLASDAYLPVDENSIPVGRLEKTAGTAMDFAAPHAIGDRIGEVGLGYDHCWVIREDGDELKQAARAKDPKSGRVMEVFTTEPGVQVYTGNHLKGTPETAGFGKHHGFCLECNHFPDSPNHPFFPDTTLRPGDTYRQTTIHRFAVEK